MKAIEGRIWSDILNGVFLRSCLESASWVPFIPKNAEDIPLRRKFYLLKKAVYGIGYVLNNRPERGGIPLKGIKRLLED